MVGDIYKKIVSKVDYIVMLIFVLSLLSIGSGSLFTSIIFFTFLGYLVFFHARKLFVEEAQVKLGIAYVFTYVCILLNFDVLGLVWFCTFSFICWFFRDPERVIADASDVLVSSGDGEVCLIEEVDIPDELVGDLGEGKINRVSVFLSVFDVHVNRVPAAGEILNVIYVPGKFLVGSMDKASEDNERNYLVINVLGTKVAVSQIAGFIARRIRCRVKPGDVLKKGERFGLIEFGSRVDIYFPSSYQSSVIVGQKVIAGETVVAKRVS